MLRFPSKPPDSLRREILYIILIEFGVPMKLVRMIELFPRVLKFS
jgi:hypothetical protein